MPLSPIALTCVSCGALAGQLSQPEIPDELKGYIRPIVKLLSLKYGPIDLPKSGNLLEAIDPDTLSKFLAVKCASCSDYLVMAGR